MHRLSFEGHELVLLAEDIAKAKERLAGLKGVSFVKGDLLNVSADVLTDAMAGCGAVVHLAALLDYGAPEEKIMAVNAGGTEKVARAAENARVKRFVFMSSTSIYHRPPLLPIDEEQLPTPMNAYGRSKLAAEKALEKTKLNYIFIRAPAIYGPEFAEGFGQVLKMVKKGNMPIVGSGKNRMPFIHVDDVVQALILAVKTKESREAFIVSSGETMTQEECLNGIAEILEANKPSLHVPALLLYAAAWLDGLRAALGGKRFLRKEYVDGLVEDRTFDISKAEKMLGFHPKVSFKEGVTETAKALLRK